MVWRDEGLNPSFSDHWRTLYPLGQWDTLTDSYVIIGTFFMSSVPFIWFSKLWKYTKKRKKNSSWVFSTGLKSNVKQPISWKCSHPFRCQLIFILRKLFAFYHYLGQTHKRTHIYIYTDTKKTWKVNWVKSYCNDISALNDIFDQWNLSTTMQMEQVCRAQKQISFSHILKEDLGPLINFSVNSCIYIYIYIYI